MSLPLPWVIVVLPFLAAAALGAIGSEKIATWLDAAASVVLFLLTCMLPWYGPGADLLLRAEPPEAHLAWLAALAAMLARLTGRAGHVSGQIAIGATMLALLADDAALMWLALAVALAAGLASSRAAEMQRQVLVLAGGLMLALFGTILGYQPAPPTIVGLPLLLGYATVAVMAPTAEPALVGLMNVPLLPILRLSGTYAASVAFSDLLLTLGIAALLATCCMRREQPDLRRAERVAGLTQVGLLLLACGLGGSTALLAGWFAVTGLTLVRSSLLLCEGAVATRAWVWACVVSRLAVPALLLLAFAQFAGALAQRSIWLLLAAGVAALLAAWTSLTPPPALVAPKSMQRDDFLALLPVWLQSALLLVLIVAMPPPLVDWFHSLVGAG